MHNRRPVRAAENKKVVIHGNYNSFVWNDALDFGYDFVCLEHYHNEADAGTITTPATCTTAGVRTYTCVCCGHEYIETIPAAGHNYEVIDTVAATCTTAGYSTCKCTACGDSGVWTGYVG